MHRMLALAATVSTAILAVPLSAPVAHAAVSGPTYVLPSAVGFDGGQAGPLPGSTSVTLPLRRGTGPDGSPVGYVITESSDAADAGRLGVTWAPKLAHALGTAAVQVVTRTGTGYRFHGGVDFSPRHVLVPGPAPDPFPPVDDAPGAVGDRDYTPLTTTGDGIVRNSPQLLNRTGLADAVVGVDPRASTVTLGLVQGFYDGHPVLYIRTESSDRLVAAVEDSTWAPNLAATPGVGSDDPSSSAREAIVPITNGQTGVANPARQGLNSLLAGEGSPLNVIQEEPSSPGDPSGLRYSPVWDVSIGTWAATVALTDRPRLTSIGAVRAAAGAGTLQTNGALPVNAEVGLRPSGAISLCPVVAVLP